MSIRQIAWTFALLSGEVVHLRVGKRRSRLVRFHQLLSTEVP